MHLVVWRVFLVEAELASGGFRLPLEYFRERTIFWKLEFDGSLKGVGLRVLRRTVHVGQWMAMAGRRNGSPESGFRSDLREILPRILLSRTRLNSLP